MNEPLSLSVRGLLLLKAVLKTSDLEHAQEALGIPLSVLKRALEGKVIAPDMLRALEGALSRWDEGRETEVA